MLTIPTFSSDGRRLRNYNLASIEKLLDVDRVAVERDRHGQITCATFRPASGANPIKANAHMGQSYSFPQQLPSGHRAWTHSSLIDSSEASEAGIRDAETFIRGVFHHVRDSITVLQPNKRANVVCIDAGRPKRTLAPVISIETYRNRVKRSRPVTARPIEFDSATRRAA